MSEELKTKYPVVLIHGTGFRDLSRPLYWGRIPKALEKRGAAVFYGQQDGWGGVETNARMIAERIPLILKETGAEKVNLIGHSKGGVEARMVPHLGCADSVASVTTVASPNHGLKTIDRLFKIPKPVWDLSAFAVNNWIRVIGDRKPDMIRLCRDLSTESMREFNERNPDIPGIFYQSFGFVMDRPTSDMSLFTANWAISRIEGPNDGVVALWSAGWGDNFRLLYSNSRRGISHLDSIDFRRRPLTAKKGDGVSDIVDVYVGIVRGLKEKGF